MLFRWGAESAGNTGNHLENAGNTWKMNDFTIILQKNFKWLIAEKNGMV
jgi:hypothetical protein